MRHRRPTARTRSRARSRGTPRIAGRLLRRVRDFAARRRARHASTRKLADAALPRLEVDAAGLDAMDRRYLTTIALNYGGGPVGVETIAAALSEPRDAIEEVIEPFLIQRGLVCSAPRAGACLPGTRSATWGLPSRRATRRSSGVLQPKVESGRVQTMEGGCHCGRIRFRVTGDLAQTTICNCSI